MNEIPALTPQEGPPELVLDAGFAIQERLFNGNSFLVLAFQHPRLGPCAFGISEKNATFLRDYLVKRSTPSS